MSGGEPGKTDNGIEREGKTFLRTMGIIDSRPRLFEDSVYFIECISETTTGD